MEENVIGVSNSSVYGAAPSISFKIATDIHTHHLRNLAEETPMWHVH